MQIRNYPPTGPTEVGTKVEGPSTRKVDHGGHGAEAPAAPASSPTLKVSVSAEAKRLASNASSLDEAKVARLREAVDKGTLKIDSHAIARKIVGED